MRRKITVQCFPPYSVLKAIGNPMIDYFSLDIEGPEYQVCYFNPISPFDNQHFNIRLIIDQKPLISSFFILGATNNPLESSRYQSTGNRN